MAIFMTARFVIISFLVGTKILIMLFDVILFHKMFAFPWLFKIIFLLFLVWLSFIYDNFSLRGTNRVMMLFDASLFCKIFAFYISIQHIWWGIVILDDSCAHVNGHIFWIWLNSYYVCLVHISCVLLFSVYVYRCWYFDKFIYM